MTLKSLINNQALENVQKCHYLLFSVTNEVHQLIQNLQVTQLNFHVAWNILCDRYNNQCIIAAAHVKSLLSLPVINKESATGLKRINNSVSEQLDCFYGIRFVHSLA